MRTLIILLIMLGLLAFIQVQAESISIKAIVEITIEPSAIPPTSDAYIFKPDHFDMFYRGPVFIKKDLFIPQFHTNYNKEISRDNMFLFHDFGTGEVIEIPLNEIKELKTVPGKEEIRPSYADEPRFYKGRPFITTIKMMDGREFIGQMADEQYICLIKDNKIIGYPIDGRSCWIMPKGYVDKNGKKHTGEFGPDDEHYIQHMV
ncbi:MAG: hypothetical protein J7M18_06830, partial [Candidatus Eremiobacteraeota bacterium]|nr:hypothetical protein [Candidatus Eremiobacteraeota bacterium]